MSVTIAGLVVLVLGMVMQAFGLPYAPEELEQVVAHGAEIVGVLVAWYGRYRQGDIHLTGQRRAVSPPAGRLP